LVANALDPPAPGTELALTALAGFLIVALALELGEDVGLLDLAAEPLEGAFERLPFADVNFCHYGPSLGDESFYPDWVALRRDSIET
jgi:hypothetical protein